MCFFKKIHNLNSTLKNKLYISYITAGYTSQKSNTKLIQVLKFAVGVTFLPDFMLSIFLTKK